MKFRYYIEIEGKNVSYLLSLTTLKKETENMQLNENNLNEKEKRQCIYNGWMGIYSQIAK